MTTRLLFRTVPLATLLIAAGCGEGSGLECGDGTVEMDGACIPESEAMDACGEGTIFDEASGTCIPEEMLTCAEGTVAMDGECVPDGSVVCSSGTTYDPMTGTCLPDITGCAEGTVEMDGVCIPFDDTLVADTTEGAEPNDATLVDGTPVAFELPAEGAAAATLGGCVIPEDFDGDGALDPDSDSFVFEASEPTLIDITIDGKASLSAGFQVLPAGEPLAEDGWIRFGLDLTSDGAHRKVLLPTAGTYVINAGDSRALLTGEPAGGMEACYFMQVAREALPAPIPFPESGVVTGTLGDPVIYTLTGASGQEIAFATMDDESPAATPALVGFIDGAYVASTTAFGGDADATMLISGIAADQEVWIVADHTLDYALAEVDFEVELETPATGILPETGSVDVPHTDGEWSFLSFEAAAGEVVRIAFDGGAAALNMAVANSELIGIASLCSSDVPPCLGDAWIQIVDGGTYYVGVYNADGVEGTPDSVTFTRTHVTPTAITTAAAVPGTLGTDIDTMFYAFDPSSAPWVEWQVQNLAGTITGAEMNFFPRDQEGELNADSAVSSELTDGTAFERIYAGVEGTVLVQVSDASGVSEGDEMFDLAVTPVEVRDLGMIAAGASATLPGETLAAGAVKRYVGSTDIGNLLHLTVTGKDATKVVVEVLDREAVVTETLNATAAGEAVTLPDFQSPTGAIAFRVREAAGAAGTFDVQLDAKLLPYEISEGTIDFVDICPSAGGAGVVHTMVATGAYPADDDGVSETPLDLGSLGFPFFGAPVNSAFISTNGLLSFGTADSDAEVKPFETDLITVEVCTLVEADRAVVQWTGATFDGVLPTAPVEFQAILHADGSIDFVYGSDHGPFDPLFVEFRFATIGIHGADVDYAIGWPGDAPRGGRSLTFTPR